MPIVYRDLGARDGVLLMLPNHFGATLDNCDPRVVDGLAATRRVIAFDNRGVGRSILHVHRERPGVGQGVLARLNERTADRDAPITLGAFRTQLKAIHGWGTQPPQDLGQITQPTFVANGDDDLMVPTGNSIDLARRIPGAKLSIYNDAGHSGIFQHHARFVKEALAFLG